jgi:hypothetical protein
MGYGFWLFHATAKSWNSQQEAIRGWNKSIVYSETIILPCDSPQFIEINWRCHDNPCSWRTVMVLSCEKE